MPAITQAGKSNRYGMLLIKLMLGVSTYDAVQCVTTSEAILIDRVGIRYRARHSKLDIWPAWGKGPKG